MRSIGFWRWYINITVTALDIIHRYVLYIKQTIDHVRTRQEAHCLRYELNKLMRSVVLWWWYINITIIILDTIHRCVFCLKHDVSEPEFCLPFLVDLIQSDSADKSNIRNTFASYTYVINVFCRKTTEGRSIEHGSYLKADIYSGTTAFPFIIKRER
jgi:hypothetical protein